MNRTEAKKKPFVEVVKELPPTSILENSRTVVEKRDFVSTGVMTMVAGDMLEVEIDDSNRFGLGENVKLTVYTPGGIYFITSTIVGKDTGSLIIINPPENQKKFADKRQHPRVEVTRTGFVASVSESGTSRKPLPKPVEFHVRNISLSGIGFTLPEEVRLDTSSHVEMEIDLGTKIPCVAEIIRSERAEDGVYYGARYVAITDDKVNSLRAFILRAQIEAHSVNKKAHNQKRLFK